MKLSLILEAIDRISGPARKAAESVGKLGDRARAATAPARRAAEAVEKIGKSSQATERQVTRVSAATFKWTRLALRSADAVDRLTFRVNALGRAAIGIGKLGGIKAFELSFKGAGRAVSFTLGKLKDLVLWGARWTAIGIAAGAGWATYGMIGAAASMETLSIDLERIEGSAAKARQGLDWVRRFSWDAVAPLEELTQAFVIARKAGLDPMSGSFQSLLDKAIESKKSIEEIANTVKEAKLGDLGGLEGLGVTAQRNKGRLTFTWLDKEGKRAVRTVRDNAREIERAITRIFEAQAGGRSRQQAMTLGGMWQRFKNMVSTFQLDIADAGIFDLIKTKLQNVLNWINAKAKDGSLKRWAQNISDALQKAVAWADKFIGETDWKAVGDDLQLIAKGAWGIATALGRMVQYAEKLQALSNVAGLLSPLGAFRGAMAGGAMVGDWFASKPAAKPVMPALRKPTAADWMGAARSLNAPARPAFAPPLNRPAAPRPPLAAPKGKLEVTIKTPPGVQARPTKVAANDMDLTVNTGKAMGGWA